MNQIKNNIIKTVATNTKAYLLDIIKPNWQESYFSMTLDEQIIGEEQFLVCKIKS